MVSIICVSNKKNILEDILLPSLNRQDYKNFELIIIDSKMYNFKSASEALNYGASIAKGNLLIFVHQDLKFIDETGLRSIVEFSNRYEFGIAGVAGTTGKKNYQNHTSVLVGKNKRQAGIKLNTVREAYTLDECLMIIKKSQFKKFDNYGETWHFYGVEYSYRCKKNNENVLLFPIDCYHLSDAKSLDKSYFNTLMRYAKRNKDCKLIRTCCGYFKNNYLLGLYCSYRKFKLTLKKYLRRTHE